MGAWSVSIMGNDTAADLRYEYEAAFSHLSPEEAVERLDAYVRRELDRDSWPEYVYSLALFLWRYGLLTENVRIRALDLIGQGGVWSSIQMYLSAESARRCWRIFKKGCVLPSHRRDRCACECTRAGVPGWRRGGVADFHSRKALLIRTRICRRLHFIR